MDLYPKLTLTLLNGFLLTIPMLGSRFGIPALLRKEALQELDYFPPVAGFEQYALKAYFITNTFLVFSPIAARIQSGTLWTSLGWIIYLVGLTLFIISIIHYCKTPGLKQTGLYRISRNPMVIGYFMIYLGISFVIGSWFNLLLTILYQIAVHWLILSEERWCTDKFGLPYQQYLQTVRRYL